MSAKGPSTSLPTNENKPSGVLPHGYAYMIGRGWRCVICKTWIKNKDCPANLAALEKAEPYTGDEPWWDHGNA